MASPNNVALPRVTIAYCTQCKWLLRAAYFAQELLSTFSTVLGEVALQPSTGGTFTVTIEYVPVEGEDGAGEVRRKQLWDRKADGGFPETKELKRRVRDCVEPKRDLGHVDRHGGKKDGEKKEEKGEAKEEGKVGDSEGKKEGSLAPKCAPGEVCEDCQ